MNALLLVALAFIGSAINSPQAQRAWDELVADYTRRGADQFCPRNGTAGVALDGRR
jgi:hypothetical protein